MKKVILLLLVLCLFLTGAFGLVSCAPADGDEGGADEGGDVKPPPTDDSSVIITPDYKDYGRGTKDLSDLVYTRPNLVALTESVLALSEDISNAKLEYSTIAAKLSELFAECEEAESMLSLMKITLARDTSIKFWQDEQEYFSQNLSNLSLANKELLSVCARSEHKSALETEFFGYSLDNYLDCISTDTLHELYRQEAEFLSEYERLSPDNVEITYGDSTGTLTEMLSAIAEKYGENSDKYKNYKTVYTILYNTNVQARQKAIFTDLLKVRRKIADELGCSSYMEVVYKNTNRGYTAEQMSTLMENAKKALSSIRLLAKDIFASLSSINIPKQDYEITVNDMYSIYRSMNSRFGDAFAYMLQHGLYDINESSEYRKSYGFTEYIKTNNSPVIFATVENNVYDYEKLSFLFGSYLDGYINYGFTDSDNLRELYSLSSELLCLTRLNKKLSAASFSYTKKLTVYNMLSELESSVRYSAFEYMVYELEYDEITSEHLEALAGVLGEEIYGTKLTLTDVISDKSITSPMANEAYITAALGSVRLLAFEQTESGAGINIFDSLLKRDGSSYAEMLSKSGLSSPFDQNAFSEFSAALDSFVIGTGNN